MFNMALSTLAASSSSWSSSSSSAAAAGAGIALAGIGVMIWMIIAAILAFIGGLLVHFLFVKGKTEPKGKFLIALKRFLDFKEMWLESILKVIYYIATIYCVLMSFSYLALGPLGILLFLMAVVLGPVMIRILFETGMMFIMIWRNTRDIADNTRRSEKK